MLLLVTHNHVHDNRSAGITASGNELATDNDVHDNSPYLGSFGMSVTSGAQALNNDIYDNGNGIIIGSATASNNRVYHNLSIGIYASGCHGDRQQVV